MPGPEGYLVGERSRARHREPHHYPESRGHRWIVSLVDIPQAYIVPHSSPPGRWVQDETKYTAVRESATKARVRVQWHARSAKEEVWRGHWWVISGGTL